MEGQQQGLDDRKDLYGMATMVQLSGVWSEGMPPHRWILCASHCHHFLREEEITLANVQIRFLPKNTTSLCQPLDQGIIRTWKAYYKQRWLRFVVSHFERDESTIANCWIKARVLAPKMGPHTQEEAERVGWREGLQVDQVRLDSTLDQISTVI